MVWSIYEREEAKKEPNEHHKLPSIPGISESILQYNPKHSNQFESHYNKIDIPKAQARPAAVLIPRGLSKRSSQWHLERNLQFQNVRDGMSCEKIITAPHPSPLLPFKEPRIPSNGPFAAMIAASRRMVSAMPTYSDDPSSAFCVSHHFRKQQATTMGVVCECGGGGVDGEGNAVIYRLSKWHAHNLRAFCGCRSASNMKHACSPHSMDLLPYLRGRKEKKEGGG